MKIVERGRIARAISISLFALILGFALTKSVYAATGELDTTFGTGGIVNENFGGTANGHALTIQPDGKIIAVGGYYAANAGTCSGNPIGDFAIARFNANGTLDSTFGNSGRVTTDFGGDDYATALAAQPDGKIVVVGGTNSCGLGSAIALARYNSDGTLDTGFGNAGKVTTDFSCGSPNYQEVNAVALQPDGKIIIAGFLDIGCLPEGAWWLARYNANGTLDNSFGNGGIVRTTFVQTWDEHADGLVIQPDGKIVASGESVMYGLYFYLLLARYNVDGTLDSTFGQNGKVIGPRSDWSPIGIALARLSDGKFIVPTYLNERASNVVARYDSNGGLDTSFGTGGWATIGLFDVLGIALQSDGRIVAVGDICSSACSSFPNTSLALVQLNSDGSLDNTFGSSGMVVGNYADNARGIAIQPDDRIVVVGSHSTGDLVLARYLSPWLLGPVININSATGNNPTVSDSTANLSANTSGSGTVTIAQYASNPGGVPSFSALGQYYDIHLSGTFSSAVASFCGVDPSAAMYFWDGNVWHAVSNQTSVGGCVQIIVNASTVPNLSQLTATLLGSGMPQTYQFFPIISRSSP